MSWKPLLLNQPRHGYRYSIDAFLVAAFAGSGPCRNWCDLGSGCGIVARLLAERLPHARGWAVERQAEMASFARLNLLGWPVSVIEGDLRQVSWPIGIFDLVVCNPPYHTPGQGRISPNTAIAEARHSFFGDLGDFAQSVLRALRPAGEFVTIIPASDHQKWVVKLKLSGWFLSRSMQITMVAHRPPLRICLAFSRTPCPPCETVTLVLFESKGDLSEAGADFLARGWHGFTAGDRGHRPNVELR